MSDDTSVSEPSAESTETTVEPSFHWSEGMPGEGDAPEWYKGDKYKSVADQAKAYTDLEKRFGGFTGAPESYGLPEEIDTEDTFVKTLTEIGAKSNMNQSTFDQVLELGEALLTAQDELRMEREMEALGPEAEQRLANIDGFMKNNLGDRYEEFKESVKDAKTVELIETLIKASAPSRLPTGDTAAVGIPTQGDIERMMLEKDDNGKVIYHYSRARQKEVETAIARMKGLQ
jgi:hypothetical protein